VLLWPHPYGPGILEAADTYAVPQLRFDGNSEVKFAAETEQQCRVACFIVRPDGLQAKR
jgi:hypothetical protein